MYYTATAHQEYTSTKARSLAGAQRVAAKRNIFTGADLHVAVKNSNGEFDRIATKPMNERHWIDVNY